MIELWQKLDGYKTYLVIAGLILSAIGQFMQGNADAGVTLNLILAALGGAAGRHAIEKRK